MIARNKDEVQTKWGANVSLQKAMGILLSLEFVTKQGTSIQNEFEQPNEENDSEKS